MKRRWSIVIRWNEESLFHKTPHFGFRRSKHTKGFVLQMGWLWLFINVNTWINGYDRWLND